MKTRGAIFCLVFFFATCSPVSAVERVGESLRCEVVSVYDGDTFRCRTAQAVERIRPIGVFAPERKQRGGKEARAELLRLAPVGSRVTLTFDAKLRDGFGRILAYAYNRDGVHINLELVRSGWSETSNRYPFYMYPEFAAAQREAMDAHRGIWNQKVCVTGSGQGTKFHPCGCWHLTRSKQVIELDRAAAKQQEFTPCPSYFKK